MPTRLQSSESAPEVSPAAMRLVVLDTNIPCIEAAFSINPQTALAVGIEAIKD